MGGQATSGDLISPRTAKATMPMATGLMPYSTQPSSGGVPQRSLSPR